MPQIKFTDTTIAKLVVDQTTWYPTLARCSLDLARTTAELLSSSSARRCPRLCPTTMGPRPHNRLR
jgi:hypothetical protein